MMDGSQGGLEQVGARIELGEIDLVLLFADPKHDTCAKDAGYLSYLCARGNVPLAINIASAEALILALSRGDLDWREAMKESTELTAHAKAVLEYR